MSLALDNEDSDESGRMSLRADGEEAVKLSRERCIEVMAACRELSEAGTE